MKPQFIITDEYDGREKLLADATIISMGTKLFTNANDTGYYLANVLVAMPHDGTFQKATTMVYEKLQDMMEYEKGEALTLLIELDGEYAGYSKVYLAKSAALDVSAYAQYAGAKDGVAAPASTPTP